MELLRQVADVYLAEHYVSDDLQTVELSGAVLQKKAGTYWNERTGGFVDIEFEDGKLKYSLGGRPYPLLALNEKDFVIDLGLERIKARFDGEGPLRMTVQSEGQRPLEYAQVEPSTLSLEQLGIYPGSYYCREIDIAYQLQIDSQGNLLLKMAPLPDQTLVHITKHIFRYESGSVVFDVGPSGAVNRFRLSVGRARNFEFVR